MAKRLWKRYRIVALTPEVLQYGRAKLSLMSITNFLPHRQILSDVPALTLYIWTRCSSREVKCSWSEGIEKMFICKLFQVSFSTIKFCIKILCALPRIRVVQTFFMKDPKIFLLIPLQIFYTSTRLMFRELHISLEADILRRALNCPGRIKKQNKNNKIWTQSKIIGQNKKLKEFDEIFHRSSWVISIKFTLKYFENFFH